MNQDCSNTPVELVLATTDPKLYNNGWTWDGNMYWGITCLANGQTNVSDRVIPNINSNEYLILKENPSMWNFCKSQACDISSESIQLVFTFNPNSTDPKDYLQFVLNLNCQVTDIPKHTLLDNSGNIVHLSIDEVSKSVGLPYTEIWISGAEQKPLTTEHSFPLSPITPDNNNGDYILIVMLVSLPFLVLLISLIILAIKHSKSN